ncbi:hypothetical protein [Nonomuraea sp. NPDC050691]|uniref:hypothetical protein n=1 Tax=Nonomuraea sp. NPDC050691 TaxID=3155661 RepID=UPI003404BEEE
MKIAAGLALAALLASGLAYTSLMTGPGSGCTPAEEDLVPVLRSQKVLAVHPDGALPRNDHSGCFPDDPFPYAGTFYEFAGPREQYTTFYGRAVRADGWRPIVTAQLSEDVCYTKKIGDAVAFLSVTEHSVEGVRGYGIDISASRGDVPADGGLMC